jgi:hypothetical protein
MHPNTAQPLARIEDLEAALYMALPFVEDHEDSPIYKPNAVAGAVAIIRKVLKEAEQ